MGFVLITTCPKPLEGLNTDTLAALQALELRFLSLGDDAVIGQLRDLDGKLQPFLERHGWDAMIVRPDFYIYGGASGETDRKALVEDLVAGLAHSGVLSSPQKALVHSGAAASV